MNRILIAVLVLAALAGCATARKKESRAQASTATSVSLWQSGTTQNVATIYATNCTLVLPNATVETHKQAGQDTQLPVSVVPK